MKYWRIYIGLWCAVLISSQLGATGDTLRLVRRADSLAERGCYHDAAVWYRKLRYFAQGSAWRNRAALSAAACCKAQGRFAEGMDDLNGIPLDGANDSLITAVKFQSALLAYLSDDFALAEAYLQQLGYLVSDSGYVRSTLLLNALVLNQLYRWDEAREKLVVLNTAFPPGRASLNGRLLDSLYAKACQPKLKDPDKAARRSAFFPGWGQCYAKSYGEGAFSFLAISACAGAAVVGIIYQYYFTSVFMGNLLIAKFYQGGVKRAEFLASRYNYKAAKEYNARLAAALRQHFTP